MRLIKDFAKRGLSKFGYQLRRIPPELSATASSPEPEGRGLPHEQVPWTLPSPEPQGRGLPHEQIPWGPGYQQAKDEYVRHALADPQILTIFREHRPLPEQFGIGLDERCVEYPWVLTQLGPEPESVLDAGSVLNYRFILEHPSLNQKRLHIITLAPEPYCFWNRGISYLFHDLRSIPTRDSYYDTIVCISTLEHVGFDNSFFTKEQAEEYRPDDFMIVMQEFSRVLKKGGTLLLTVPFGKLQRFSWQQQFDTGLLSQALAAFGETSTTSKSFYRYGRTGWDVASEEDCAESEYVQWLGRAFSGAPWPDPMQCEPDRAAAARAVACIRLKK